MEGAHKQQAAEVKSTIIINLFIIQPEYALVAEVDVGLQQEPKRLVEDFTTQGCKPAQQHTQLS